MLLIVAVVTALEAALLLAVAGFFVVELLRVPATSVAGAVVTAVLAALMGAFLLLCARHLLLGRRWARAPVITWQLLQASVAVPTTRSDVAVVGWLLLAASVVVTLGVLTPQVRRYTAGMAEDTPTF